MFAINKQIRAMDTVPAWHWVLIAVLLIFCIVTPPHYNLIHGLTRPNAPIITGGFTRRRVKVGLLYLWRFPGHALFFLGEEFASMVQRCRGRGVPHEQRTNYFPEFDGVWTAAKGDNIV